MLVGPVYFASMREAEEKALAETLERRRMVAERLQIAPWSLTRLVAHGVRRSRRQMEECCSVLEEGAASLSPGMRSV